MKTTTAIIMKHLTVLAAVLLSLCRATSGFAIFIYNKRSRSLDSTIHRHPSTAQDTTDGNDQQLSLDEISVGSLPQNPFLPLLSKGLLRMSLAMDKATSDQLFLATPSLQRLRQQIVQLTEVGPSSLGEKAGLGLFASRNIKVNMCAVLDPQSIRSFSYVPSF